MYILLSMRRNLTYKEIHIYYQQKLVDMYLS